MVYRKIFFSLFLACLTGLLISVPALAFPPLPSSFYGDVKVDGKNVPDGTLVRALIDGTACGEGPTQTYEGASVFSINVLGADADTDMAECGQDGDKVQFEVGGVLAEQTGVWHSGTNVRLDLTASVTAAALNTPAPTAAPLPTQTPVTTLAITATSEPASVPNTGGPSTQLLLAAAAAGVVAVAAGVWRVFRKHK